MATLTIALSGVTGGPNGQRDYTVSDAHVARWITSFRTALNLSGASVAQVLAAWADAVVDRTKRVIVDQETKSAAATPISITPSTT
jgi:DNA-binding transcriptional MerR regulator